MASEFETALLGVIGIGIIVVGVIIIMEMQKKPAAEPERVIVREDVRPWWPGSWGPYWSHLPVRPVLY